MEKPETSLVEIALILCGQCAIDLVTREEVEKVNRRLNRWFPGFEWKIKRLERTAAPDDLTVDPLDLLTLGYRNKLKNRCDAAVVLTGSAFEPIANLPSRGIVSNALEVAVGRIANNTPELTILRLLAELWGEEMTIDLDSGDDTEIYTSEQIERITDRLDEISDARVEESPQHRRVPASRWRLISGALFADPKSLLLDVIRYRPWAQPFRMGRLTAAAGVSTMILILAAESWEVGVNLSPLILAVLAIGSLIISTAFLIKSQDWGWRTGSNRIEYEQEARTAWVVSLSIGTGMTFFGFVLFLVSFGSGLMITDATLANWVNREITLPVRIHYAIFTASLGLLAATAGGNLEEERKLKARLLVDREIV